MTPKYAILIMLTLPCLASTGCATGGRRPLPGGQVKSAAEIKEDEQHANLERELSLYSD
jgi:hypothetical protein